MDVMGLRRRMIMQIQDVLPAAYRPVEYIWGDGRQRIVTDVLPDDNDVCVIDFQLFDTSVKTGMFGCANGDRAFNAICTNNDLDGYIGQIGVGNNYKQSNIAKDTSRHLHTLDFQHKIYTVDDVETDLSSLTYTKVTNAYSLWHLNGASGIYIRYTCGKLYGCKIKGRLDLRPCVRISDDEPGLYDIKTHTFYTNIGDDSFHVGYLFDCNNIDNYWLATSASQRVKSDTRGSISQSGDTIILTRTNNVIGLTVALGYLENGKTYAISGQFGNIDGNAYIARVSGTLLADKFNSTRKATNAFVNNVVQFSPSENGIYELLVWESGTNPITAENINIVEMV